MQDIILRAGSFISIIIIGHILRRIGFFAEDDFKVLSKIVIRITLPAAIILSFSGKEFDLDMLAIVLLGLGGGLVYVASGYLLNLGSKRENQAFDMLNTAGYNIGNFTLPFVQSFLGPMGVITTSLFDTGNAAICLGGSYSLAAMVKEGSGFSFKKIGKALLTSGPFMCYILMIALNFLNLRLPSLVISCAEVIGNANAFMAMLMIGVGFNLSGDFKQIKHIAQILIVRYGFATIFALLAYNFLPFSLEIRQALVILFFSPIAAAVPAFTNTLKEDVGLSSAVNSISIICSIVIIVGLVIFML